MFSCLAEVEAMVEDFRLDYNDSRPHRAHAMLTPSAFAQGWRTAHDAAPAGAELQSASGLLPFNAGCSLTLEEEINHQLSEKVDR